MLLVTDLIGGDKKVTAVIDSCIERQLACVILPIVADLNHPTTLRYHGNHQRLTDCPKVLQGFNLILDDRLSEQSVSEEGHVTPCR